MAELADALASGASLRKEVQVQVLLPAPLFRISDVRFGSIAQLGEHLPYKQRVIGSSPIVPTNGESPHLIRVRLLSDAIFFFVPQEIFFRTLLT